MKKSSAVMLCAVSSLLALNSCKNEAERTLDLPVRVTTQVVSTTDVASSRTYSGTIAESESTVVSFGAPGTISRVFVSAGDRVSAGQLIATIDDTTLRNAYDIAQTTTAQAQDAYDRMKMLHDSNSIPDMKWVEVENALRAAKSAEAIARKALDDAKLYAPFSGYVSEKFIDAGAMVAPGVPVVKIMQIHPVKVKVSIPETEVHDIPANTRCVVTVGALNGRTFEGRLAERGIAANPVTRAYEVSFTVGNDQSDLLPGMICDVNLYVPDAKPSVSQEIVLDPSTVLLDADNRNFVWLDSAGYAVKRIVDVKGFSKSGVIIDSGLQVGDSVIVAGQQKVSSLTPVKSIN